MEASLVSHSTQSESAHEIASHALRDGKFSDLDMMFPLLEQAYQFTPIPIFFMKFLTYWVIAQVFYTSFWPYNTFYENRDTTFSNAMYYLGFIFWLSHRDADFLIIALIFAITTTITILSVAAILSFFYYYRKNHRFLKWMLFPSNFIFSHVSTLLLHPISGQIATCITKVGNGDYSYIAFLCVLVVCWGINFGFFLYGQKANCRSIYLKVAGVTMFTPHLYITIMISSTLCIIAQSVVALFARWAIMVLAIFYFIIYIVTLRDYKYHALMRNRANPIMAAVHATCALDSLFQIILFCFPTMYTVAPIIFAFAAFIMTTILFWIFMLKNYKIIKQELSIVDGNTPDFDALRITRDINTAKLYLRVGFVEIADTFIDFSLVKYLSDNCPEIIFDIMYVITFFPSEYRKLNVLFMNSMKKGEIKMEDRFLIYQINKLQIIRQFSQSNSANEKLLDLKDKTMNCEALVRAQFNTGRINVRTLEDIDIQNRKMKALWEEAIVFYPNNPKMYVEYSRFLIEAYADYEYAIRIKGKAELIENGVNFAEDRCYKMFVKAFPNYLKQHYLDFKGNIVLDKKLGSASSSSNNHSSLHSSGLNDSDFNLNVSRQSMTYGKLRVALSTSLKTRSMWQIKVMPISILFIIIVNIVIFFVVNDYIIKNVEKEYIAMERLTFLNYVRAYMGLSYISDQLKFAQLMHFISDNPIQIEGEESFIPLNIPFEETSIKWLHEASDMLEKFLNAIAEISANYNDDIYYMAGMMLEQQGSMHVCVDSKEIEKKKAAYHNVIDFFFYLIGEISYNMNPTFYINNSFCMLSLNYRDFRDVGGYLFFTMTVGQNQARLTLLKQLKKLEIALPFVVFVITFLPTNVLFNIFVVKLAKMNKMIVGLDRKIKDRAKQPIMKDLTEESFLDSSGEGKFYLPRIAFVFIPFMLLAFCSTALMVVLINFSKNTTEDMKRMNEWQTNAEQRLDTSIESMLEVIDGVYQSVLKAQGVILNFSSPEQRFEQALKFMQSCEEKNRNLLEGSNGEFGCAGQDSILDELNIKEKCTPVVEGDTHELYKCGSANQDLMVMNNFIFLLYTNPLSLLTDKLSANHMIHVGTSHLWHDLAATSDRIKDLARIRFLEMKTHMLLICIIDIVVVVLITIMVYMIIVNMKRSLFAFFILLKRINPIDLVNDKGLMSLILERSTAEDSSFMSLSRSVIHNSTSAIVCTTLNGTIELSNPAMSILFGYKPEQLLGQNPSVFFDEDDAQKLENQMILMAKRESATTFDDHLVIFDDSGAKIPVYVTIMLMLKPGSEDPHSFVIILDDETELINKQNQSEIEKVRSEKLLYQILPRDIVIKLNSEEKDISFVVPSASIIFVDIQRFSDYSASLQPSEIMYTLSTVFAAFDQHAAKYPLLTKIKLIGDDYMAAAGLFSGESEAPQNHAIQIIKFGLDCLMALDEVNVKLNASLSVRVGINSGGPLIAGVLGTDKPVFDIIGDPINVAARLQTSDEAGKIQVSKSTFELVKDTEEFQFEERGEIFLKGKGKSMTYFVLPFNSYFAMTMSTTQ